MGGHRFSPAADLSAWTCVRNLNSELCLGMPFLLVKHTESVHSAPVSLFILEVEVVIIFPLVCDFSCLVTKEKIHEAQPWHVSTC